MVNKFKLESDYIELAKLLKVAGICDTGGMAKVLISEGRVKVDGIIEFRKGRKVRSGQTVEIDGHIVEVESSG